MKDNTKSVRIALIVSILGLIIASINLIYSKVNGLPIWSAITIFCAAIAIFCANTSSYKSKKNNDNNTFR